MAGVREEWDASFGAEPPPVVVVGGLSKGEGFRVCVLRVVGWWIWRAESGWEGKGPERGVSS